MQFTWPGEAGAPLETPSIRMGFNEMRVCLCKRWYHGNGSRFVDGHDWIRVISVDGYRLL